MASTPVSPKVTAGASVAAIVALLLQVATNITPASFAFLGAGQCLAYTILVLAAGAGAAWWKTDPLREAGATATTTAAPAQAPAAGAIVLADPPSDGIVNP